VDPVLGAGQPDSIANGLAEGSVIASDGFVATAVEIGARPGQRPVFFATQGSDTRYIIKLMSGGTPVNLRYVPRVAFLAKESDEADHNTIDEPAVVDDAANGLVTVDLPSELLGTAGVFRAGLVGYNAKGSVVFNYDAWLNIALGLDSGKWAENRPITIGEVRSALMDRCAADNDLLDDLEFTDAEIVYNIADVVCEWNETSPIQQGYVFAWHAFPYRVIWVDATIGKCLSQMGLKLLRNTLQYSAGGVNVTDKSRAQAWIQLGKQYTDSWKEWMRREKGRINAESCYAGFSSIIY
jgi:hypothetical protein